MIKAKIKTGIFMKKINESKSVNLLSGLFILAMLSLAGCAETTQKWDQQFGDTTRQNLQDQIIDPLAGNKKSTAYELDGRVAKEMMIRYQNSYKEPAPESNNFTIGVGK